MVDMAERRPLPPGPPPFRAYPRSQFPEVAKDDRVACPECQAEAVVAYVSRSVVRVICGCRVKVGEVAG